MSGKLLDTNAAIAIIEDDADMQAWLERNSETLIPSTVVGELYFGAYKSSRVAFNVARIEEFVAGNRILPCDAETGKWYGQIKQELKSKGGPIPENDVWIAAVARQYDLTLVTRDDHFQRITLLQTESW